MNEKPNDPIEFDNDALRKFVLEIENAGMPHWDNKAWSWNITPKLVLRMLDTLDVAQKLLDVVDDFTDKIERLG